MRKKIFKILSLLFIILAALGAYLAFTSESFVALAGWFGLLFFGSVGLVLFGLSRIRSESTSAGLTQGSLKKRINPGLTIIAGLLIILIGYLLGYLSVPGIALFGLAGGGIVLIIGVVETIGAIAHKLFKR